MANRFIQYIENSFKENWDLPAFTNYETKQSYAYKDVVKRIAKLHILFREMNISQQDKISLIGRNTPEWAVVFLAAITYGAIIVPILQDYRSDDLKRLIDHSESKLLFIDDEQWNRLVEKELPSIRAVFSLENFHCLRQSSGEVIHVIVRRLTDMFKDLYPHGVQKGDVLYTRKDDSEMCILNYTSGTTGFSKGVVLAGSNFSNSFSFALNSILSKRGDRIVSYLHLAHIFGFGYDVLLSIIGGRHVFFLPVFSSVKQLLSVMLDIRPNNIAMVPIIVEELCKELKNSKRESREIIEYLRDCLERIVIGGASLNHEYEVMLKEMKIPYSLAYAMTECGIITMNPSNEKLGSVGKCIPGVEIIVDSKNPILDPGDILVKGTNVSKGYYKNDATYDSVSSKEGWFNTGDLGIIDEDGYLYIKGRSKSMILTSTGQNIYPENIEAIINKSPYVFDSLVVQRGERIVALLVPDRKVVKDENVIDSLMADVIRSVNKQLPVYSYIHDYEVRNVGFERTPKMNVKRFLYN